MTPSKSPDPSPSDRPTPTPSPSPSPSRSQGRSSAGSPDSLAGSAESDDFVADAGPEFDPDQAPAGPSLDELDEAREEPEWIEDQVKAFLRRQGQLTHWAFAIDREGDEWLHTKDDLDAIAPPATRILNRYDATRVLAAQADELELLLAMADYTVKNFIKRRRALARKRAAEEAAGPQPVSGVAAPPGTGPESDPEYQRLIQEPPAIVPRGAAGERAH